MGRLYHQILKNTKFFYDYPFGSPYRGVFLCWYLLISTDVFVWGYPPQDVKVCLSYRYVSAELCFSLYICMGDLKNGVVTSKTQYTYSPWNQSLYLGGGGIDFRTVRKSCQGSAIPCKLVWFRYSSVVG